MEIVIIRHKIGNLDINYKILLIELLGMRQIGLSELVNDFTSFWFGIQLFSLLIGLSIQLPKLNIFRSNFESVFCSETRISLVWQQVTCPKKVSRQPDKTILKPDLWTADFDRLRILSWSVY